MQVVGTDTEVVPDAVLDTDYYVTAMTVPSTLSGQPKVPLA